MAFQRPGCFRLRAPGHSDIVSYLITGIISVLAGVRALGLRRRQLSAATAPAPQLILRPAVLAVLAGIAFAG
ncbi:hypothetical protein ABZ464_32770 [Streptomyces sp. NPDC005820]|uniref:hypothetical protein n=1 Tax=Streptomyces sp. NPDC005820 TaxID=3157069 RepID=UPI0033DEE056